MIVDFQKFVEREKTHWEALEKKLNFLEGSPAHRMSMEELQEFHHLYRRASSGLNRVTAFAAEKEIHQYLESLVSRAYGEIHEVRGKPHRFEPHLWFFRDFPRAFRRHLPSLGVSTGVTLAGILFGVLAFLIDPDSKEAMIPFSYLGGSPTERVQQEESSAVDHMKGQKASFASYLMANNIKVSLTALALGMTWGIGTLITLFYTGVMLGVVAMDYIMAGHTRFLLGWLLPHGALEIPSILIAGQAGFILAGALIGWGRPIPLSQRFREVAGDLILLTYGLSVLLVGAGFIESFLSQYHEPVFPYAAKIALGVLECLLLGFFLIKGGAEKKKDETA